MSGIDSGLGQDFRDAMSLMTACVAIIAARRANGARCGMTATAVCSLSMDPPSIVICVNKATTTIEAIDESGVFSVNLAAEHHESLSNTFARHAADEAEADRKFLEGAWVEDPTGAPVLADAMSAIVCRERMRTDGGSHWIIIGDAVSIANRPASRPLLYGARRYHRLASA